MQFKKKGAVWCAFLMGASLAPSHLLAQSQRAPINLGTAGNFEVLAETGITDVPPSVITGNIGASPITGAAVHLTCAEVTGTISVVDAAGPAPCALIVPNILTQAISDMQTAYTAAAGVTIPDFVNLGAGDISGMTLVPGLYKWSTGVAINSNVTLSGGPNSVWIFQIAGDLLLANNIHVVLAGGAQANNIFWQVAGPTAVTLGTGSVFSGTILSAKQVIMNSGATLVGRALAQTQVTLQSTGITSPGPLVNGIPPVITPSVTATVPANLTMAVPIGNAITATFSEAMDPTTITAATFTVKNGANPVAGTVTYVGVTATFTPSSPLPGNTLLTGTVTTGAKDLSGAALAANYVWTFTTGVAVNLTPPAVSSTIPLNGTVGVPINSALAAVFTEPMNPATINASTFLVKQGAASVSGTVTYVGVTATFTPAATLAPNLLFTATITTGVTDLAGNALASNYVWTFTTGSAPNTTPPTVSSTVPSSGSANVPPGNALAATFSEAMNPLTINTTTFSLKQGVTPVTGAVTYVGVTATFTPSVGLLPGTLYTATITSGAKDLAGNALAANYVWSFATLAAPIVGPPPSLPQPTITSMNPANGAINVPIGNALAATFSTPMNPFTINTSTFSLKQGATPVAGAVTYVGLIATFTPLARLAPNAVFTATVTNAAADLANNNLNGTYVWNFTTGSAPDTTPPTVISTVPANSALLVTVTANVVATFSKPINPLTITTATYQLQQGTTPVPGTVVYNGSTATFMPTGVLAPNTVYNATITSGVTDLAGNALAANYKWSFTTGSSNGQSTVCLTNFAVFSSSISSSGSTVINGDVGVSSGGSLTGFPPGTVNGAIHNGDAIATQALADFNAAYRDAVSRSVGPVLIAGDIGGQTFTPGLYRSASTLTISSGNLILDAGGDVNAVFIFQIASSLNTAAANEIVLTGGAKAYNVFWQVGTDATLGATSVFNGSILAGDSITVNLGVAINGRIAARTGAISLLSDTITSPPPVIGAGAILNAAAFTGTVAPGSIAAIFGNNFGSSVAAAANLVFALPTTLGQSSFEIGAQPAPLYMVSCSQANVQIPWESAGQTQTPVTVTVQGVVSAQKSATVAPFAPGIFVLNSASPTQGAVEISPTAIIAGPAGPGTSPVARGQYISIFATGLGAVTNQPATGAPALVNPLSVTTTFPTVNIGGQDAEVTFSGLAPGFAGLNQVNVIVPAGVTPGSSVPLVLTIGGVASNTVTIAVQ